MDGETVFDGNDRLLSLKTWFRGPKPPSKLQEESDGRTPESITILVGSLSAIFDFPIRFFGFFILLIASAILMLRCNNFSVKGVKSQELSGGTTVELIGALVPELFQNPFFQNRLV